MKTKLLLAAVILAGIVSTTAIAGRNWNYFPASTMTNVAAKPANMSCCGMGQKAPAKPADKTAPATSGMSCHPGGQATKDSTTVQSKGCCK